MTKKGQSETIARRHSMLRTAFQGIIRDALDADNVIEILANPDGSIWIERTGIGITRAADIIESDARERIIRLVASAMGQSCNRNTPVISGELPVTGERFEGLLPPIAIEPCFAIRKAATTPFTIDDYIAQGALAPAVASALRNHLNERSNILIAGGTSSGKTTFTNALLAEPSLQSDRIVILEDTRELQCSAINAVSLRTDRNSTTLSDLVRSTMRLRPDRIVVGEVRGPEALDLLKAWNTGHPGGVTTLHANSASAALGRLEQLIAETTQLIPKHLIAEAIDVIVYMSRRDGIRKIEDVRRMAGLDEHEEYRLDPLITPQLAHEGDMPCTKS